MSIDPFRHAAGSRTSASTATASVCDATNSVRTGRTFYMTEAKTTEYLELVKQLREWPSHSDRQWAVECGQAADAIECLLACVSAASKEHENFPLLNDDLQAEVEELLQGTAGTPDADAHKTSLTKDAERYRGIRTKKMELVGCTKEEADASTDRALSSRSDEEFLADLAKAVVESGALK